MQAAQIVHAAGESSPGNLEEGTYAVVLTVPSERELRTVLARLKLARVELVEVYEPDPPWEGALMALGLRPKPRDQLRRFVSSLSLLR